MNYQTWFEVHYQHLYEIYYHIIVPKRSVIKEKYQSTLTFEDFCNLSYASHGRLV